jgi:DNA-binding MarR family transcriptional regulator
MTENPIHLEAWRLFITTHAALIDTIDRKLTTAGKIPLQWYDVLIELYEAPERKLRMRELADKVVLSKSGLTRLVDRLEEAGYLKRDLDPNDRRSFFASITPEGIDALRDAWAIYSKGIEQYFGQHLSEEEAQLLAKLFMKMLNSTRSSP